MCEELTAEHEKVLNLGSEVRSAHASSNIDHMAEVARQIEAALAGGTVNPVDLWSAKPIYLT